mgnify:FL=1
MSGRSGRARQTPASGTSRSGRLARLPGGAGSPLGEGGSSCDPRRSGDDRQDRSLSLFQSRCAVGPCQGTIARATAPAGHRVARTRARGRGGGNGWSCNSHSSSRQPGPISRTREPIRERGAGGDQFPRRSMAGCRFIGRRPDDRRAGWSPPGAIRLPTGQLRGDEVLRTLSEIALAFGRRCIPACGVTGPPPPSTGIQPDCGRRAPPFLAGEAPRRPRCWQVNFYQGPKGPRPGGGHRRGRSSPR